MKKAKIAVTTTVLAIACVIVLLTLRMLSARPTLTDEIGVLLDSRNCFSIVSLERMEADRPPVYAEISALSEGYDDLMSVIKKLQIKYIRSKPGMELTSPLYTFTVTADDADAPVSITVNDKNQLHFNQTDATYSAVDCDLYGVLKTVFAKNSGNG